MPTFTPDTQVMRIEGEMTIFRAEALKPLLLAEPPPTQIDLSGVTEIDTAGVQLLLLAHRRAAARRLTLRLIEPSEAVDEVLVLLNLEALRGGGADQPTTQATRAAP